MGKSTEEAQRKVFNHDTKFAHLRPPVPGEAIDHVYLPAMGFMMGKLIAKGQVIRIITLEGPQAVDTIIWDAKDLYNVSNCWYTQLLNRRWDKHQPGEFLYSRRGDRLAIITQDTTDGTHAFVGAFCSEHLNWVRYGIPGTVNCHDNLVSAMAHYGLTAKDIDWGSCYSFFMDMGFSPDGNIILRTADVKPGDYIDLLAEMDIIIAISNCPSRRHPCNAYDPTSLQAIIFSPNGEYKAKAEELRKKQQEANPYYPAEEHP
jgi:uncharacterized protein YcgI (DUF1989 family)